MGSDKDTEQGAIIAEKRQILFSNMALLEAVLVQLKKLRHPIPAGQIEGVKAVDDGTIRVTLQIRNLHTNILHDLPIAPEITAAGLIAFCVDHRIPVPRRAEKSLGMFDGQMALIMELPPRSARLNRREALRMG